MYDRVKWNVFKDLVPTLELVDDMNVEHKIESMLIAKIIEFYTKYHMIRKKVRLLFTLDSEKILVHDISRYIVHYFI